jgi:hypothetical protein
MTMTTAFGVAQDASGAGTDPLTLRRIIRSLWTNTGIVSGLDASGSSGLTYTVGPGMAVCSMADSDGYVEAYWPGGGTENAVDAGDQTYPRIDTVYMIANTGSPDNLVHVMAAQGTPGATPAPPSLPVGALRLMDMLLPAGASSTQSASANGTKSYAIPYGASMGRIGYAHNDSTISQAYDTKWYVQASASVTIPTDRSVDVRWTGRASRNGATDSSYFIKVVVDGRDMSDGNDEINIPDNWERKQFSYSLQLSAGTHVVQIQAKCNTNKPGFTWRGIRMVEVFDRGVSQ